MLEQLKEIKEKLNLLIQEVEQLENAIHGEELIIEKKDFKLMKRKGRIHNSNSHIFEYFGGVVFTLSDNVNDTYLYSMFMGLLDGTLPKIILIKREQPFITKEGYKLTHLVEQELDTKLREAYRNV